MIKSAPSPLDPVQGPPIRFHMPGMNCFIGNRPTRLYGEMAENDNGTLSCEYRDPRTGEVVETWVAPVGTIGDHEAV